MPETQFPYSQNKRRRRGIGRARTVTAIVAGGSAVGLVALVEATAHTPRTGLAAHSISEATASNPTRTTFQAPATTTRARRASATTTPTTTQAAATTTPTTTVPTTQAQAPATPTTVYTAPQPVVSQAPQVGSGAS
jgi:hypothetical protein